VKPSSTQPRLGTYDDSNNFIKTPHSKPKIIIPQRVWPVEDHQITSTTDDDRKQKEKPAPDFKSIIQGAIFGAKHMVENPSKIEKPAGLINKNIAKAFRVGEVLGAAAAGAYYAADGIDVKAELEQKNEQKNEKK